ncbi:hypothetical protein [Pollutimonas subterranea]|nr:hypothetical protein [Pollutimonas subterranea]
MTWPSCQESWPVFVLLNGVGFGAVFADFFAVGVAALYAFEHLSTGMAPF